MDDALATAETQAPRGRRAGGGREAKRAARSARAGQSAPYITRKVPYYEVLDEEGLQKTENGLISIANPIYFDENLLWEQLEELYQVAVNESGDIKKLLKIIVPTYNPKEK